MIHIIYNNMKKFIQFYSNNNFNNAVIATVLSRLIADLLYSFIDNIIYPLIKIDLNNDGKPDINSYVNSHVNIFGIKLKLSKFIIDIFKFLLLLYIIYLIMS